MLTGKTESGFEYKIQDDMLDNWEILEALADIDEGHFFKTVKALRLLLGEEQKKELEEHCRDKETGIITSSSIYKELHDIITLHGSDNAEKEKNA